VPGEAFSEPFALPFSGVLQPHEVGVEKAEQVEEGFLVSAMGRGGEEHQMAGAFLGEIAEQFVAEVSGRAGIGAGVRLID
jgi:hypothetical protein